MNRLNELIHKVCSDGVEYTELNSVIKIAPKSSFGVKQIQAMPKGKVVCFTSGESYYYVDDFLVDGEYLFMNDGGNADVKYFSGKAYYTDHVFCFTVRNMNVKFVFYFLKANQTYINEKLFRGIGLKNLNKNEFKKLRIPNPPLYIQEEIVKLLDKLETITADLTQGLGKEIEARKKQYEYYKNMLFSCADSAKMICVTDLCDDIFLGLTSKVDYVADGGIPLVRANNMTSGTLSLDGVKYISNQQHQKLTKHHKAQKGDILVSKSGTLGVVCIVDIEEEFSIYESLICLHPNNQVYNRYLLHLLRSSKVQDAMLEKKVGNAIKHLNLLTFRKLFIPLPSLEQQKQIADVLDRFDSAYTELSSNLIAEIEARKKQYEFYLDKLLTFKEVNQC